MKNFYKRINALFYVNEGRVEQLMPECQVICENSKSSFDYSALKET